MINFYLKIVTLILGVFFTILKTNAQSTLTVGDIAIVGIDADEEKFAFVLLKDIEANTQIYFTDSGVQSSGKIRGNEGAVLYTAPMALGTGTIIEYNTTAATDFVRVTDAYVGTGGFNLSSSGDQVIAFVGSTMDPKFIFAAQTNSNQFQTDSNDSNQSDVPPGLTVGLNAVAVGAGSGAESEFDNSVYNLAVTAGTKQQLLLAITNNANWNGSNDPIVLPTSSDFNGTTPDPNPNPEPEPEPTPVTPTDITLIHDIQGNGDKSDMVNAVVLVEGIVVGDFQEDSISGLFIQEEDSDADTDEMTSEGIFIFSSLIDTTVTIGDKIQIVGTVSEFFEQTQINNVTSYKVISKNNLLPTVTNVELPVTDSAFLERYEGMYVIFNQQLFVTDTFLLGRGNELKLSSGSILFQPTQIALPGTAADEQLAANALNQIIIDDANRSNNLEPIIFPTPELTFENEVRAGFSTPSITGVLTYNDSGFSTGGRSTAAYRVYVTELPEFDESTNPRTKEPSNVGGSLKVASFNVLNYFNGNGLGEGFPTSRGADTAENFKRQRDKIINAIKAIDADIVGLVEIENDGYGPQSAITDLVNGLNEALGADVYAVVNPGVSKIGTDQIATGFIYKPSTVSLQGPSAILTSSIDPTFSDRRNRPSLAQTFKEIETEGIVTISVNHLKSKGSGCDGDPDLGDGQANCNLTRKAAAIAITNWLANDPTNSGSSNFVIIGDLNSYAKEDPIVAIENAGYTNLVSNAFGSQRHGYQFASQFGTLDYAFASNSLLPKITGADFWNINADEPVSFDYTTRFKSDTQIESFYSPEPYRSSDHDPVVFGLDLSESILSVTENELNRTQIHVYPMPMTDNLNITSYSNSGITKVSIYTLSGRELITKEIKFNKLIHNQLNTSQLSSGAYLLVVTNGTETHHQILIK